MATNPFEQFVDSEPVQNPFAQFVRPEPEVNPFAQFVEREPTPEEQSFGRQIADVPLKLGAGAVQGVRMIADAFGAGSNVSKTLKGAEDWIAALYSAQARQDSREISRIMKEAEDKGATDQISAALKAFLVAPIDLISQGLGTAAPAILTALGTAIFGAPTAIGTAATLGVGALMGAGTVKGTIYDAVKEELAKTDMPADQIEARARLAQEYGGENLDMILTGAAIGGISARTGLEGSIARATASRIMGKAAAAEAAETAAKEKAAQATAQVAARGPLRQGARTAAVESGTEFAQAGQEQIAENIALQREGFDVPTFRGAVGAGTLEALVGAPLGGAFGAREAVVARQEQARLSDIATALNITAADLEAERPLEGTTKEEAQIQDRIIDLMASRYESIFPSELAYAVALQMNEIRRNAEAEAKTLGLTLPNTVPSSKSTDTEVGVNPMRVRDLEDGFISAGVEPGTARAAALAQATEEAYNDWIAEKAAQGEPDVRQPIATTGGEGVPVVTQPDVAAATGRPPTAQPAGVDVAPTDVGVPTAGKATTPGAVKVSDSGAYIPSATKGEAPLASAAFRTITEDDDIALDNEGLVGTTLITGMNVQQRNKGLGSKLLNSIIDWADSNGKTLALVPAATPDVALGGLNQEQLRDWYAKNGFVSRDDYMVRNPQLPSTTGAPSGTQAPQAVEAKEKGPAAPAEGTAVEGAPAITAAKPAAAAKPEKPLNAFQLADKLASEVSEDVSIEDKQEELKKELTARGLKPAGINAAVSRLTNKVAEAQPKAEKAPKLSLRNARFAGAPGAERLFRASAAGKKYPGKFWSSIKEYAERYLTKGADKGQRTLDETAELPKRTLNVTTLSQAPQAERDAFLGDFTAWMQKNAPDVPLEDTQLYDVLTGQATDFAYPQKEDVKYLKYMGYDSVFFAEEGGEKVDTWFVFDKKERAETVEPKPKRERGRPALPKEEREARAEARTGVRAQANRDARRLQKAASDLTTKDRERRTNALYNLYDIYKTSQSTPRRSQAKGMLDANTTEAERRTIEDGYKDWQAKQAEIAAFEAAEREQKKAARLTPEQKIRKNQIKEETKAIKFDGSSIYIVEDLPNGEIGLVLPIVSIRPGPILTEVNRGRSFLEAKKAEEQLAFELATKNVEGKTEGSTFRMVDKTDYKIIKQKKRQEEEKATAAERKAKQTERIKRQREDKINAQKDKIAKLGKKLAAFRQNKPVNEAELLLKEKQYKLEQLRLKVFEEKPIDWDADWEQGTKVRSLEDAAQEIRALQPKEKVRKGKSASQLFAEARAFDEKAVEEETNQDDNALASLFDKQVEEEEEVEAEVEAEVKEPVTTSLTSKTGQQLDMEKREAVTAFLLGGKAPAAPTVLYRGIPEGENKQKQKSVNKYVHVTPWFGVARTMGSQIFAPKTPNILEFSVGPDHLYYRGGALEGDPLESTRIHNTQGMTWAQALEAAKALFEAGIAELKKELDANEINQEQFEKAVRITAIYATDDFRVAVYEADAYNRPGKWVGRRVPESLLQDTPALRTKAEIAADELVEEPKELTPQEQYAALVENTPGAPAFDALSKEAQDQITDLAKRNQLNLAAINRIAAEQAPKFSQAENVGKADVRFNKFTTVGQAAAHVARTGNAFQRALARRLSSLKLLQGTKFVVLEPGDPTPKQLEGDDRWLTARGVFVPETNTVYVRSAADSRQGVNNITVLHEAIHVALQAKINAGRQKLKAYRDAVLRGKPADITISEVESLFIDLSRIARRAETHFRSMADMSTALMLTVAGTQNELTQKYDIFSNLDEFLSYGMSDPVFQTFLKTVPMEGATGFSKFVKAILRFLGMAANDQSALARLVDVTDRLLSAPEKFEAATAPVFARSVAQKILKTATETEAPSRRYPKEVVEELTKLQKALGSINSIKKKAQDQAASADKILNKVLRSHSSGPAAMQGLQQAVNNRGDSKQNLNDVLAAQYKGFKGAILRQLLPVLQTETLVDWAGRLGLNNIVLAYDQMKNLHAAQVKGLNDAAPISQRLVELQRANPGMYRALAATMHYSTLRGIDPSTEAGQKASPSLARLWNSLNPEAKNLYETVRDYHAKNYDKHFELLERLVDSYGLEGNIADASTPKGKLIASIRRMQEQGAGIKPYFPLMRFGNFWVRTGEGKDSTFHMFESQAAKEAFIAQYVKSTGESSAKLYAAGVLKDGNDISSARKDMGTYNDLLRQMFANIDSMKTQEVVDDFGNTTPELVQVRKEQLKDNIYQMILHTLPDASYRKQFIHRQGKEGFSEDIARSFATLSTAMSNQLARLEYSQQVQNALSAAKSALQGNPDAARLNEFVKEMKFRANLQLDPSPENSVGNQLSNFANQTAFLYMMTNVKTAVAQMFAIPTFVAPVLASKHGVMRTALALGSFSAIWNSVGMRKENADGSTSWVAPTIAQSKRVKLNPEERRAAQYMIDRGLSETTLAYDLGNRKQTPTEVQNSTPRRFLKASVNAMTALFHHTERLIREVSFMASFRLNRKKFPNKSFEEIVQLAEKETLDALGNYASVNRPRGLGADVEGKVMLDAHKPIGRAVLQFKMFPAFVTTYFVRNFYRMLGKGYSKGERKAAFMQFFGTLMMSFTLAGVMGIPGFSFAFGVLSGLRKLMADDDDDDPLKKRDLELWFRNVWMPQTFGDIRIGNKPLSDIMDRGVLAAMTGFDMTSSLSMNGLWLPSLKESPNVEASVKEYLLAIMGPFASLASNQVPRAIDNFNQGKIVQGMEQLMPAIARSPVTAYRYATEGAQTTWGEPIKPAREFTIGQIIGQSLGFSTEGLVARREDLFRVNQQITKVDNEKRKLMDRLDLETRTDDDVQAALEKIVEFNRKNWFNPIKGDDISKSLIQRMERRERAERGLRIESKYYPQMFELLEGSRRKLEAEAAR